MTLSRLVIGGALSPIPERDGGNRYRAVYKSMVLQIARDYAGLPDVRTLTASQIRFFYNGLVPELIRYGK